MNDRSKQQVSADSVKPWLLNEGPNLVLLQSNFVFKRFSRRIRPSLDNRSPLLLEWHATVTFTVIRIALDSFGSSQNSTSAVKGIPCGRMYWTQ